VTTGGVAATARLPRRTPLSGAFGGSGASWLLGAPLLFLALLLAVPIAFLVQEAIAGKGFSGLASDEVFRGAVVRTLLLALTVAAIDLVLGTIYAIALAVAPRWLVVLLVASLFTIFWTSLLVRTYGWLLMYLPEGPIYSVLHAVGLRDEPVDLVQKTAAAYPAMVHVMLPYVVLPVWAAARQIDPTQLRAARTLGARPPLIVRRVILPQLRAGMAAGAVLVFIMSLGFYVTPQLLGNPRAPMVAGIIGQDFAAPGLTGAAAAMSLVLLVVVIVVYVLADRLFKVSEQWGGGGG
jgi:putative spermidine/putrescine transport system permease protein